MHGVHRRRVGAACRIQNAPNVLQVLNRHITVGL